MFIVWRKKPIKTNRATQMFLGTDMLPDWKRDPIFCRHTGTGRLTWTPLLMYVHRWEGEPHQKLLEGLPAIRSCCIADSFMRAAWWRYIDEWKQAMAECPNEITYRCWSRDQREIMRALRRVVPHPTPAGIKAFTAYRLEKEADAKREFAERAAHYEQERQRQEEQRRQRNAEEERSRQQWQEEYARHSGRTTRPSWWIVLGLSWTANLDQVKARYRLLAKEHHPDRGGDPQAFMRVRDAYEQALAALARCPR